MRLAQLGAVAAATSMFAVAGSASGAAWGVKDTPVPEATLSADVVVVGGHAAGLGAAITAARRGLRVILVTSETTPGGMLTAGQIAFSDGSPIFAWPERTTAAAFQNGDFAPQSSSGVSGSLWRELRERIAAAEGVPFDLTRTLRFEPRYAVSAVNSMIASTPNLVVLRRTMPVGAQMNGNHVVRVDVSGAFSGHLTARYWVDGSNDGELVGLLHLPYAMGTQSATAPDGDNSVQSYAYRWTAIEQNIPGGFPTAPPLYYAINRPAYRAATTPLWPAYARDFGLAAGTTYAVHPLRLFGIQGRLTGANTDPIADPVTGLPPAGAPTQVWDVNNGPNDADSTAIGLMLSSDQTVQELLARYGLPNVYASSALRPAWSNTAWIEDSAPIEPLDKAFLLRKIDAAVRARALGFLYYIRSGDLLAKLHELSGAQNVTLRSNWSVDNELGTADGFPELMYEREERRVVAERTETVYDLCPTFDVDRTRADRTCQTAPHYLPDAIAVGDFPVDIHTTAGALPFQLRLIRPYQVSFAALIPKGTTGLLVGSALGADRFAYGALRVDPLRLMIGNAIGEAIAQASRTGTTTFQGLDMRVLRETLAADHQQTFYDKEAPRWDGAAQHWVNDDVGAAIQTLAARDWITHAWDAVSADGTAILDPALPLDLTAIAKLQGALSGKPCAPTSVPWGFFSTVGEAYLWLAARPWCGG